MLNVNPYKIEKSVEVEDRRLSSIKSENEITQQSVNKNHTRSSICQLSSENEARGSSILKELTLQISSTRVPKKSKSIFSQNMQKVFKN